MSLLYNRKIYVIFGPSRKLTNIGGNFFITGIPSLSLISGWNSYSINSTGWPFIDESKPKKDNKAISDLRISFIIKKNLEVNENELEIEIYNVSKDTYKLLQQTNETYKIQISVGYGEAKDSIFLGDIENSYYYREGPNWILKIKGKDGQEHIQDTIINKSYKENFTIKDILLDAINTTNILPEGTYKEAKKWIEDNLSTNKIKTQNGLSLSGRLLDELNKLLSEINATLSIQDGKAQIIYKNSNNKNDIIVLSPSTGLIGSPIDKGIEEGLEFKSLLIPLLKPGGLVKIESKTINDYYRIDNISYKGDTHGNDWECNCQATKPNNIIISGLSEIKYYDSLSIEKEINSTWKNLI